MFDFRSASDGKASAYNAGDPGSIPSLGRSRGEGWQPVPVFLPGKSHGWRSLVGYSLWGCKESDKIEQLNQTELKMKKTSLLVLVLEGLVGLHRTL